MATNTTNLNHEFRPQVSIEPVNPKYELKPFVSGWFLGFNTEYKKVLISHDGLKEVWTCVTCGRTFEDDLHKPKVVKIDRHD